MKKTLTFLAAVCVLPCAGLAEETEAPKPEFDKTKAEQAALPMPNPYDKLLAIEEVVGADKVDWNALADGIAVDVEANNMEGKTDASMALGVKIADGIVAIKAQNAEKLQKLSAPENRDNRTLVIASGWLQGARYASALIEQNYTPELSNILREPLLAGELRKQVAVVGGAASGSPKVQALANAMTEAYPIVNIPLDASISKEDVAKLKSISDTAVEAVTAD
jgi:hypothetical protein